MVFDNNYGNISSDLVDDAALSLDFDGDTIPDEAALVIIGPTLGLMQVFFQREDLLVLDEVREILLTLGELEEDMDNSDEDPLAQQGIIAGLTLAKAGIQKLIKDYAKTQFQNAVKYYQ